MERGNSPLTLALDQTDVNGTPSRTVIRRGIIKPYADLMTQLVPDHTASYNYPSPPTPLPRKRREGRNAKYRYGEVLGWRTDSRAFAHLWNDNDTSEQLHVSTYDLVSQIEQTLGAPIHLMSLEGWSGDGRCFAVTTPSSVGGAIRFYSADPITMPSTAFEFIA